VPLEKKKKKKKKDYYKNFLLTVSLICIVVSRSRKVTVLSLVVWKSRVIPNGIPSSSFLAYLRPIVLEESSTRLEMLRERSLEAIKIE